MRKIVFLVSFGLLLFSSCEEEPLPINMDKPQESLKDTFYMNNPVSAAQDKIVFLEDFTGVQCAPCPNGHKAVKDILAANPGRVVAVAIHPGGNEFPTATAFPAPAPDLNTTWGTQIFNIIGKPNGIPYGTADRVEKSVLTASWSQYVTNRLAVPTPVNLDLTVLSYDENTRELAYEVRVEVTGNVTGVIYFSTMISEDNIISKQKYDGGTHDPYTHNHILRNMPNFGVALNPGSTPALAPGLVFVKQYKTVLNSNWVPGECNILAFVHKDVEVLQAAEKSVK